MDAENTAQGIAKVAPLDLPRISPPIVREINRPDAIGFVERPSGDVYRYGLAHAFIARFENCRVIGSGSVVTDEGICVHGLSSGNYSANIRAQLAEYDSVPQGNSLRGEHVLIWGCSNFGHWLFTYLMRATLLLDATELLAKPLLIHSKTPRRFVEWIRRMGFDRLRYAEDGDVIERLYVPSVVCYRGHYEDMAPFIHPEALHRLRRMVLNELEKPHRVRERIYLSRKKAKWRRLENEEEVASLLARHGIKRVYLEELTLERQLDLISRAELIIVHAGATSPITMFAPRDCVIAEISIPQFVGTFASRCWSHILGQRFHRINAVPTAKTGPLTTDYDSLVKIEELDEFIRDCCRV